MINAGQCRVSFMQCPGCSSFSNFTKVLAYKSSVTVLGSPRPPPTPFPQREGCVGPAIKSEGQRFLRVRSGSANKFEFLWREAGERREGRKEGERLNLLPNKLSLVRPR